MTTDRELLEGAAKAAGINAAWEEWRTAHIGAFKTISHERHEGLKVAGKSWNPLTDDGDALRLAVKLRIAVTYPFDEYVVRCWYGEEGTEPVLLELGSDPYAATRHAITRAAYETSKGMK